jgi:hypothetical protein
MPIVLVLDSIVLANLNKTVRLGNTHLLNRRKLKEIGRNVT